VLLAVLALTMETAARADVPPPQPTPQATVTKHRKGRPHASRNRPCDPGPTPVRKSQSTAEDTPKR